MSIDLKFLDKLIEIKNQKKFDNDNDKMVEMLFEFIKPNLNRFFMYRYQYEYVDTFLYNSKFWQYLTILNFLNYDKKYIKNKIDKKTNELYSIWLNNEINKIDVDYSIRKNIDKCKFCDQLSYSCDIINNIDNIKTIRLKCCHCGNQIHSSYICDKVNDTYLKIMLKNVIEKWNIKIKY